ncbi:MAG: hypothetical protein JXM69_05780 [Anaerolineae bacterium]|nr:hypothetical protein [Anaerolineae bacterium]
MYSFILIAHSMIRWIVLVSGLIAVFLAFAGWFGKNDWIKTNDRLGAVYVVFLDLNVLLGLILYLFLSPITQAAFSNFGAAMGDSLLRFFAVEHIFGMLVALVLAHVGRALSKKATETVKKHRATAIWYTLSLLVILATIPWDRPFLRLG